MRMQKTQRSCHLFKDLIDIILRDIYYHNALFEETEMMHTQRMILMKIGGKKIVSGKSRNFQQ